MGCVVRRNVRNCECPVTGGSDKQHPASLAIFDAYVALPLDAIRPRSTTCVLEFGKPMKTMSTFDGTTLYEILQHYDRGVSPPVVTCAFLGETYTPTDALLCGVPPAGGEWSTDRKLYTSHVEDQGLQRETLGVQSRHLMDRIDDEPVWL